MIKLLVTPDTPNNDMVHKVTSIINQSKCPNESFEHTFGDDYKGMDADHIYIGGYSGVETPIEWYLNDM